MLVKPTVPELLRKSEKNRYSLVIATAKRARQISNGSKPMTEEEDTSPVTLAANEIGEGKVTVLDEKQWEEFENDKNSINVEENIEDNQGESDE